MKKTLRWRNLLSLVVLSFCVPMGCAHNSIQNSSETKAEVSEKETNLEEELLAETLTEDPQQTPGPGDAPTVTQTQADVKPSVQTSLAPEDQAWMTSASLEEKVSQMFIFGFMGHSIDDGLRETLEKQKPGAIIVFGRNIKSPRQVVDLLHNAQGVARTSSRLPLLVAVDQEGGNVIRLKTSPPLPSALALGETGDQRLVYHAGLYTGQLLKTLGFNVNLAPVLDVADPDRDPFLGTRTFGKDAKHASKMGASFSRGLNDATVMPTAKHFPGHGGVADSHKSTPTKPVTLEELTNYDLVPFSEGFKEVPTSAVMLAHIAYPKVDPSGIPATFSKPIVTDLLRNSLGFSGLVMTDDIEMAGAFAVKDPRERAIRAIEAGVDVVMIAWNKKLQAGAIRAVTEAVQTGRISEARIEESVRRILIAKRKFAHTVNTEPPTTAQIKRVLKNPEMQELALETLHRRFAAERSQVTVQTRAPAREKNPVFVFATQSRFYTGFKSANTGRRTRYYQLGQDQRYDVSRVLRANLDAIAVIHVSGNQSARVANRLTPDLAARTIVINSETRGLLKAPKYFRNVVDVHFKHPDLGKVTAEYFFASAKSPTARQPAASAGATQSIDSATASVGN